MLRFSSSYASNLVIYGNLCYDFPTNKTIVELTISFIIASNRFRKAFFQILDNLTSSRFMDTKPCINFFNNFMFDVGGWEWVASGHSSSSCLDGLEVGKGVFCVCFYVRRVSRLFRNGTGYNK